MKRHNEYLPVLGKLYDDTPKAVFAAIALSLSFIDIEGRGWEQAVTRLKAEWLALYNNGIVPQRPPRMNKEDL